MDELSKSKRLDVVLALLLFIPVALVFQQSATSLAEQGVADGDVMNNAAMFPKLLAILLGLLAAVQIVVAFRRPNVDETVAWSTELKNALIVIGLLAGYVLLVPIIGYHLMTPLLCFSVLFLLGLKPFVAVGIGVAMSIVVALFFETLLNVVLPVGMFGLSMPF